MSVYLHFDNAPHGDQVASSGGWGDFVKWCDGLEVEAYNNLVHLAEHGWVNDLADLEKELAKALEQSPPDSPDVVSTAEGLAEQLAARPQDADVVSVSHGMDADDGVEDPDDAETKSFSPDTLTPAQEDEEDRKKRDRALLLLLLAFWYSQKDELLAEVGESLKTNTITPLTINTTANAKLAMALLAGMTAPAMQSAQAFMAEQGVEAARTREVARVVHDELAEVTEETAALINESTLKRINSILETIQPTADDALKTFGSAMDDLFIEFEGRRAEGISADMEFVAGQVGATSAAKVIGAVLRWDTAEDDKVCAVCDPLDGVEADAGAEFAPGIRYPVSDTHANCRCTVTFVRLKV